ncbi:3-oxoacyl-[acyl-carrier-protein] synthase III C-terminal domain-containing protein [Nocardia alni]|uniref:3-oxoacyl-[acyl-carrier-protein] synthase III C-terminal domain-containing protein n=1 Tax=Nocardia alni TaxID=2815723 RepID=UPI001C216452|nr:3-oxoacyl-[acyl-carrier-protein] synthase III C-terminal domain-containing protein [Nocardia alni]
MRIGADIRLEAVSVWIPEDREPIPASSKGPTLPSAGLPVLRVESLPVSLKLAAPEMAVLAARDCLGQAGQDPTELYALIHSHAYHQGHDVWPVAHYIAHQIGASGRTLPLAMQGQFCNGALTSVGMGASMLLADTTAETVLLTTADRFCAPGWVRWEEGRPGGYGDGATAALLKRGGSGSLRVLSVAHFSEPRMEKTFRGEEEFTPAPMWNKTTIEATSIAEIGRHRPSFVALAALRDGTRHGVIQALQDAHIAPEDDRIRYVVLPHIDQMLMDIMYSGAYADITHAELLVFGEHTGHLGPGDPFANLVELRERGLLHPGEIILVSGIGAGWTWSTAVIEVVGA